MVKAVPPLLMHWSGKGMSSALANGLAGAGGGLIAQILTYPLQAV